MSTSNVYSPDTDISFNDNIVKPLETTTTSIVKTPLIPFWGEDPNILLQSFDYFPVDSMTYNQNLNAISRLIILITFIGFVFTRNFRLIIIGAITLAAIYILFIIQQNNEKSRLLKKEDFKNPTKEMIKNKPNFIDNTFDEPSVTNPFSNVLIPDYEYNLNKKPAPPSFNMNINDEILRKAKQTVADLNPDQPDISDKLFRDLGEQYVFEQSLRPFYSTASTTIPNDQQAFAEFCYGSMISCKEGNPFACARNLSRYTNV